MLAADYEDMAFNKAGIYSEGAWGAQLQGFPPPEVDSPGFLIPSKI